MDRFLLIAIVIVLLCLFVGACCNESTHTVQKEGMDTCQVSSDALRRCTEGIAAYTAAIQAAQDQAQKDAAAVNQRNIAITAWESEYSRQLRLRDEGRVASSKQVWYQNKLYDCSKLPEGS